ncbi:MAG TPA: carbon monoxide dehydrogenase accessory protein CooC [Anaerovoracaceae bacterium]|nr:carbon monoxide dehydrogenase accessory protein CooC [Anaerovoracaceae bacterium]
MKIAVTGKGGVGKTTIAGTLARIFSSEGHTVLAIDADPDANLASAIGMPEEKYQSITPFSRMRGLAEERTESTGTYGGLFILNPKVDDLPDRFCVEHEGVKLLIMGTVEKGGGGCVCPQHTLLKRLMRHLLVERDEVVIMDMEAGVEHLGRGTAEAVDALLIVAEPGSRSIQTALRIRELAEDIGIKRLFAVGSKVRSEEDIAFLRDRLSGIPYLGSLPFSQEIVEADLKKISLFDSGGSSVAALKLIKDRLVKEIGKAGLTGEIGV